MGPPSFRGMPSCTHDRYTNLNAIVTKYKLSYLTRSLIVALWSSCTAGLLYAPKHKYFTLPRHLNIMAVAYWRRLFSMTSFYLGHKGTVFDSVT